METLLLLGEHIARYGVVFILFWFGLFKFTPTEADDIRVFVGNSPLMSWLYRVFSVRTTSRLIGVSEILTALLMALRPLSAEAAFVGGLLGAAIFINTLLFMFTIPNSWTKVDGLWVPGTDAAFILKDLVLLGFSLWSAGEAYAALQAG